MRFLKRSSAFTLIEIIAVISIIIILIGLLSPALNKAREQAKKQKTKAMIGSLEVAINMFYTDIGNYPPEDTWALELAEGAGNYGSYMDKKDYVGTNFIDPWGDAYNYDIDDPNNTGRFDLWSNGPNGTDENGGGDDITNW